MDWEIYPTLLKEHGLIGLRLLYLSPNPASGKVIVPQRLYDNLESGYAPWRDWTRAESVRAMGE